MKQSRYTPLRGWLAAVVLLSVVPAVGHARAKYSEEGAKACIDCHETPRVMGIALTAHAKAKDPNTPAAQKQCQSCHGPSATHMQFPMQVSNVHFGKGSKDAPEVQNQMCLECHESEGAQKEWKASAHGFEKVLCSTCHNIHDPQAIVPASATVNGSCSDCHDKLMGDSKPADFSHALGRDLGEQGQLTCAGCHDPHGPLSSSRCDDCHPRTTEVRAAESERARRFHEVAERKATECIRCHKGIAHPIPPLLLQQSQEEMEALAQP